MKEDISENLAKGTILLLEIVGFEGAQNELNDALDYYKNGNYNYCVLETHKAYESTMKCILGDFNICPKNLKTGSLITALHNHDIFSSSLDNYAHTLKNLFEQLLPNIRNQEGISHGQGKSIKKIDESYANLAFNTACTFISFLVKRYQKIKPDYETGKKDKSIKYAINKLSSGRGTVTTVKSYEPFIEKFCSELNKDLSDINEDDIITYLKKCKKKKYSTQTLWLISSALRFFTNDYKQEGIIKRKFDYSKIRKIVNIGKFPSKRKTKPISEKEFHLLLKNEPNPKHVFWIEFIWHTGLTTNQFRNIRIRDLDFSHNTVKLRKGNRIIKEPILPTDFMIKCRNFIEKYSNEDKLSHLFIGYKGGFIHPRTLQNALSLAGKRANIKRNIHCQVLRISNKKIKYKIDNAPPKKTNKKYITLKAIRYPFEPISVEELEQLCSRGVNEKHKSWFKIIYYLGIYKFKRDALYSLKMEDINLKNMEIKVNSKWVHLSEKLFSLFKIYFRKFPNQKYVFENKYGGTISDHGMRDAINRARKYNNIKKPINYENLHKSILEFNSI